MNSFYEYFNIPKINYYSPGRTYDSEGNCCEYYIEMCYPSIEPVYFQLLVFYNHYLDGTPLTCTDIDSHSLCNQLTSAILQRVQELEQTQDVLEEKQEVYDIFEDYYCFEGKAIEECSQEFTKELLRGTVSKI